MSRTADIDLSGDQASGLRRLFRMRAPQVVAFASGRESWGRSALLVQTAAALAASGHGVVVVDENPDPDNVLSAFGLNPRYDLMHVVAGERSVRQVVSSPAPLLRLVAAERAARELHHGDVDARRRLAVCLDELGRGSGFVLIDCAPRRHGQLSALALAARHLAVVVAAHGSAITEAYALIKSLVAVRGREGFQVVVTHARVAEEARAIFDNLKRVAGEHLGVRLDYLGAAMVPATEHLADALTTRLPPAPELAEDRGYVLRPSPTNAPGIVMV